MPAKKKPKSTSVRLPDEMDQRMRNATKATGESQSNLIVACVARSLESVVLEIIDRRRRETLRFMADRKNKTP